MSLAIGLSLEHSNPPVLDPASVFDFDPENEGYYYFLWPHFKRLAEQTGQYIDLCGDARFDAAHLDRFERVIAEAREQAASMPERWDVETGKTTGTKLHPTPPTPVYA